MNGGDFEPDAVFFRQAREKRLKKAAKKKKKKAEKQAVESPGVLV